jgi:hypothetical protein
MSPRRAASARIALEKEGGSMGEAARKRITDDALLVWDDGPDRLRLESIGFDIGVASLYDGLDFAEGETAAG